MKMLIGCTTIQEVKKGIKITHMGNMGTTLEKVRKIVDLYYGKGSFDYFRQANGAVEEGTPDYLYTLFVPDA